METKRDYVYGKRSSVLILLRLYFHRLFQGIQALYRRISPNSNIIKDDVVIVAKGFYDTSSLVEFFEKCNWYLHNEIINFSINVDTSLKIDDSVLGKIGKRIKFVENCASVYKEANFILLNNWKELFNWNIITNIGKVRIIDKTYFSYVESLEWQNLLYNSLNDSNRNFFTDVSKKNFLSYQYQKSHKTKATCFVTGPSFSEYSKFEFNNNDLIVICNSIVKDHAFLEHTKGADILTFADPVFHFSFNEYAKVFRENMIFTFDKYKFFVTVPMHVFPVIYYNYPSLRNHLIGVVYKRRQQEYNIPSHDQLWVKDNANILTNLMIPMACAVSDQICIIGADGRKPDEKYFWAHNSSVQFDNLMSAVFEAHPSFFRDRDYKDYYEQHCQCCDELLNHCEAFGKQFSVLTNSYIPAFNQRLSINETVQL